MFQKKIKDFSRTSVAFFKDFLSDYSEYYNGFET